MNRRPSGNRSPASSFTNTVSSRSNTACDRRLIRAAQEIDLIDGEFPLRECDRGDRHHPQLLRPLHLDLRRNRMHLGLARQPGPCRLGSVVGPQVACLPLGDWPRAQRRQPRREPMQLHHEAVQVAIARARDVNSLERVEGGIDLCTHLRDLGSDHRSPSRPERTGEGSRAPSASRRPVKLHRCNFNCNPLTRVFREVLARACTYIGEPI